jgi:hypothetical protein
MYLNIYAIHFSFCDYGSFSYCNTTLFLKEPHKFDETYLVVVRSFWTGSDASTLHLDCSLEKTYENTRNGTDHIAVYLVAQLPR